MPEDRTADEHIASPEPITVPWPQQSFQHHTAAGRLGESRLCWAVYPETTCLCGRYRLTWEWTTQARGTPDPALMQATRVDESLA